MGSQSKVFMLSYIALQRAPYKVTFQTRPDKARQGQTRPATCVQGHSPGKATQRLGSPTEKGSSPHFSESHPAMEDCYLKSKVPHQGLTSRETTLLGLALLVMGKEKPSCTTLSSSYAS